MFPFWGGACYTGEPMSRRSHLQGKLKFLRWMRDDIETRLAGLNAAIGKIEEQLSREDAA